MYDLLAGLSVIEASSFVASPTAGLYLAQMGAEVILSLADCWLTEPDRRILP